MSLEDDDPLTRKEKRHEKKIKRSVDRSKYKKTDQEKFSTQHLIEHSDKPKGLVIKVSSLGYEVFYQGKIYLVSVRGKLKKETHKDKNLVTIGDYVFFDPFTDGTGVIEGVLKRKSELVRETQTKKKQLIAANIDQVLITVSVNNPILRPFIIDRYIISALKGGIRPKILINKMDLLETKETSLYEEVLRAYQLAHIPILGVSVKTGENLSKVKAWMKDQLTVFSGQSGVGKSSLINALLGTDFKVGSTVKATKKGAHTTTNPTLVPLDCGGFCIDTPGIKSFGLWEQEREPLDTYFYEFQQAKSGCAFHNCTHTHENNCGVKQAIQDGLIAQIRYDSYLALQKGQKR